MKRCLFICCPLRDRYFFRLKVSFYRRFTFTFLSQYSDAAAFKVLKMFLLFLCSGTSYRPHRQTINHRSFLWTHLKRLLFQHNLTVAEKVYQFVLFVDIIRNRGNKLFFTIRTGSASGSHEVSKKKIIPRSFWNPSSPSQKELQLKTLKLSH